MTALRERMAAAVADEALRARLDHAIGHALRTREERVAERPDWDSLCERAARVRREDLGRLPDLLEEFERNASERGMGLHYARDAREACEVVAGLVGRPGAPLVKSKSMVTEEIGLRAFLARRGVEVIETDLGEYIVQLGDELPSHIVAPALHLSAADIAVLFREKLGLALEPDCDARTISLAARDHLRRAFLGAEVGMCGANFLAAREGAVVVCTNEGNAGLCTSLPERLIVVTGVDKVWRDLETLRLPLLLLGSSSTGQRQTCYVRLLRGPRGEGERDGPARVDIVLVDNGRSELLAAPRLCDALSCIRCGACMYVCPIYRRSGGQAYGWMYPGPIGILLAPFLGAPEGGASADACSLCGACAEVCPVRIPLPELILEARAMLLGRRPLSRAVLGGLAGLLMSSAPLHRTAWDLAVLAAREGHARRVGPGRDWCAGRDLPSAPPGRFSDLWAKEAEGDG